MKRYVFTIELKDDAEVISAYKGYHRHIWPEVKEALYAVGVKEMQTYLLGNRLMTIMETEDTFDPDTDLKRYATCDRVREWDQIMNSFQVPVKEAKLHEWWARMELVYDYNWI